MEYPPDLQQRTIGEMGARSRLLETSSGSIVQRQAERAQLQNHWQRFRTDWDTRTKLAFPALTASNQTWITAVREEPSLALKMMRDFPSPAFVLGDLSEAVCATWTAQWKHDYYEHTLISLNSKATNPSVKELIANVIRDLQTEPGPNRQKMIKTHWSRWRAIKYGGYKSLQICDPFMEGPGSRHVLCALIYAEHIRAMGDSTAGGQWGTSEAIDNRVNLLNQDSRCKKIVEKSLRENNWAMIESHFVNLQPDPTALSEHEDHNDQY